MRAGSALPNGVPSTEGTLLLSIANLAGTDRKYPCDFNRAYSSVYSQVRLRRQTRESAEARAIQPK